MGYIRGREGSRLTLDFWLADGLRRQELEGLRLGLGKDDEFSVRLIKCERLREDYPSGQLGMGFALEVILERPRFPQGSMCNQARALRYPEEEEGGVLEGVSLGTGRFS